MTIVTILLPYPLYNNATDIQPDVHSTNTHGTNEVNFAILHFFGYQCAPRYRDIYDTVSQSLYRFKHPSQYGDVLIKPVWKINTQLIIQEWENIQRIILSLALKTTTRSIIIGKLSDYARKTKLSEPCGNTITSSKVCIFRLHLLFTDTSKCAATLESGESYHKVCRAVSCANFGKLRVKTEQHQQIWGECSRLIANCIMHYNASIVSNRLGSA